MRYPAQQFADDTGISQDIAERMLKAIYDDDNNGTLDVQDINSVLWRLKDFIMKTRLPELLDDLSDDDIDNVVDQLVLERNRYQCDVPSGVCCAETVEELQEAFREDDADRALAFLEFKAPMSDDTKSKISAALKQFYYGKGGKTVNTRGGKATTVDPGSLHEFLKTMGGMPKAVVDAAKSLPTSIKSAAAAMTHITKKTMGGGKFPQKMSMPESALFFAAVDLETGKTYKAGDIVTVQILRAGEWDHPSYGKVKITPKVIKDIVQNFKENKRGIELCVDENHDPDHKATAWFREVAPSKDGKKAFAKIELTQKGADLLNEGAYKYFSPEFMLQKTDEETGETTKNLLIGGALTNRPFFKGMQPLMASESAAHQRSGADHALTDQAYFFSQPATMHKLLMLLDRLCEKDSITASEKAQLELAFADVPEEDRNAKLTKAVEEVIAKFDEEGSGDGAAAAAAAEGEGEAKPAEGEAAADASEETDEDEEEAKPEEGAAPAGVEGVKANEDGTFVITDSVKFAESLKGIQSNASKLSRQFKEIEVRKKLKALKFSEKNPKGVLLPKHITSGKFTAFAMKLSEPMAKEFFELLKTLQLFDPKSFSEKGHGKEPIDADYNDPKTFSADEESVRFFMESMGQSLEEAQKSAATAAAAKAGKPKPTAVKA